MSFFFFLFSFEKYLCAAVFSRKIELLSTSILTLYTISTVAEDNNVVNTNKTTSLEGAHTHTVSVNSGGSGAPATRVPAYLSANVFVYLGN